MLVLYIIKSINFYSLLLRRLPRSDFSGSECSYINIVPSFERTQTRQMTKVDPKKTVFHDQSVIAEYG